jgi:predicted TIM-barrel enzyme
MPARSKRRAVAAGSRPPVANLRITDRVPTAAPRAAADDVILVCPWLAGLPRESALWISALPIHDANGFVDGDLRVEAPAKLRARLYFGVFALDRLRSCDQLLEGLRNKGVERLINLPSVSFFDASTARTFDMLDFNLDQEIAFLLRARHAGFSVALCARRGAALSQADAFDFLLLHEGPGAPMELVRPRPS